MVKQRTVNSGLRETIQYEQRRIYNVKMTSNSNSNTYSEGGDVISVWGPLFVIKRGWRMWGKRTAHLQLNWFNLIQFKLDFISSEPKTRLDVNPILFTTSTNILLVNFPRQRKQNRIVHTWKEQLSYTCTHNRATAPVYLHLF